MKKLKRVEQRPTKLTLGITYRGVSVSNSETKTGLKTKFRARIKYPTSNTRVSLGYYDKPELAAEAYNKAAKKYFGKKEAKKIGRWNIINAD